MIFVIQNSRLVRKFKFHRLTQLAILISTLATASFFPGDVTAATKDLSGEIQVDGSSTTFPLTEAVAEEFRGEAPKVHVTVGVSGTGGGFKKFLAGETAINDASRPIKDTELKEAKKNKIDFIELPIAFDGLSVVVSQKNDFIKTLSLAQLKKLWEPSSKVKLWSDLDPSYPKKEVVLYGPGPDSGTFDFFTSEVVGKERSSRSDYTSSEDDNVLVKGVAGDPYALAYFGYAYYLENKDTLKAVPIDTGKEQIAPTAETIETGKYPISRPLLIYVARQAADRPEVEAFVNFYLSNAPTLAKEVGYSAMPTKVSEEAKAKFKERQTGTWYSNPS